MVDISKLQTEDTVMVKLVVKRPPTSGSRIYCESSVDNYANMIHADDIVEIIPKPWTAAVGDKFNVGFSIFEIMAIADNHAMIKWSDGAWGVRQLDSLKSCATRVQS